MTALLVVAIIVVVIVVAAALWVRATRQRRQSLQDRFGPEYTRTVDESDSRRAAERELAARQERHDQLDIRPLSEESRARFAERWTRTQADFVDSPNQAMITADSLVEEVMSERGYPTGDFERRTADLSVEHADVLDRYRAAHHVRGLGEQGQATTEQLREAMVHYRALFERLLEAPGDDAVAQPADSGPAMRQNTAP